MSLTASGASESWRDVKPMKSPATITKQFSSARSIMKLSFEVLRRRTEQTVTEHDHRARRACVFTQSGIERGERAHSTCLPSSAGRAASRRITDVSVSPLVRNAGDLNVPRYAL